MKTGLLGFLLACAGAYSAYIADNHADDVRANEFAKYIHSQIDSMATGSLTEKEIDSYIRSYKKNPELFDAWVRNLASDSVEFNKILVEEARLIYEMDSEAGRKLEFSEAMKKIERLEDDGGSATGGVFLKRHIGNMQFNESSLKAARVAKHRLDAEKSK